MKGHANVAGMAWFVIRDAPAAGRAVRTIG